MINLEIPAVILYNSKSHRQQIGQSDLTDIADLQKAIYNEYSEMEQLIKMAEPHPISRRWKCKCWCSN